MPKTVTTSSQGRAAEPSSEIDELADDPALQPRPPSDPARLAKVPRGKKSAKSADAAAAGTENDKKPPRGESQKQKRRAKSANRDAEGGDSKAAPTAGAARLAPFRYAGPSAGSHQRIDPTTLEDSMASSSDPVDASPVRNPTHRAPKRPFVQEQTLASPSPPQKKKKKKKKRTLSATNGTSGPLTPSCPTKTVEEPVFVMPEFDEDGNLIEDENENSLAPASSSSSRDAARPFVAPVKAAFALQSPAKTSSAEAFAVAVGSSPAANRLPSSIELPNSLAQRIYRGSPSDRKQVIPGAVSARDAQRDPAMMSDAGDAEQECSSSAAAKPKAPAPPPPQHPLPATPRKSSIAQPSPFRPAKKRPNTPKVLSSADLLAVAEVLAGLDSQALDDFDDEFELAREGNAQPSAAEKAMCVPEAAK